MQAGRGTNRLQHYKGVAERARSVSSFKIDRVLTSSDQTVSGLPDAGATAFRAGTENSYPSKIASAVTQNPTVIRNVPGAVGIAGEGRKGDVDDTVLQKQAGAIAFAFGVELHAVRIGRNNLHWGMLVVQTVSDVEGVQIIL